jgi:ABC-type nitrate/sulfonate/bicarbonate transport system ATPase subunit
MTPILSIKSLSHTYTQNGKNIPALSGIDMSVNTGEFVCIIGPNGCGKSTLLKIIAGILPLSTHAVDRLPAERSYLPQGDSLLPWRTVEDNLYLPGDIKHIPHEKIKKKADALLKEFGLAEFSHLYPAALSGGMQQKAAIARTIIHHSSFILLDEPFAALDALTRIQFQQWLKKLVKQLKSTAILVTHDIREAVFLADTIYVMSPRPGKIIKKYDVSKFKSEMLEKKLMKLLVN